MQEILKYVDSPSFDEAYERCYNKKALDKAMLEGNLDMFKKLIGPSVLSKKDLFVRAIMSGVKYYMHKSKPQLIDEIENADKESNKRSNSDTGQDRSEVLVPS